jgi:hypothetical protein
MHKLIICLLAGFMLYYYNTHGVARKMKIERFSAEQGLVYIWERGNNSKYTWDFVIPTDMIRRIERR